ncbi:MAG: hypothetical protein M3246_09775 [Actinomycetota bacterium]|nr:hypothetical protein [Actinomycetota bacterium]
MEYPKMDRGLGLLMRMNRSLEEARVQGEGQPRLEFCEDSYGLTIRPTIGGATRGEELHCMNADASDLLRSLETDGYVALDLAGGGPSPSTGVVALTEKGLDRIRYRRAFESNLPRSSGRWGFSLLGGFLSTNLWQANWEGRSILVKNELRLAAPRGRETTRITEYLNVDGRFPPGYRVTRTCFSKDLYGELRARDGVHEVHGHIGLTSPWLKVGCLIAVDGVVIGGDVGKKFVT